MFIVIFCSLLALLLTYLESIGKLRNGMLWGFALVTLLGCIHYDYGNDYMGYYEIGMLVESTPFDLDAIMAGEMYREPGWVLLNYLFKPIGGFFTLVFALNIFQNAVIYKFIRKNLSQEYYTFSVFIYLFFTGFYLINFSMMRQGFAICVFLALWNWIEQKKWLPSLIIIYLCSFIHSSMIITLPFAFWGFLPLKNKRIYGLCCIVVFVLLWISADFVNLLFETTSNIEEMSMYYSNYGINNTSQMGSIGFGFILGLIPIILSFWFFFQNDINDISKTKLVSLSIIGSLTLPLSQYAVLAGRIGGYFSAFNLVAYPYIYGLIRSKPLRVMLVSFYVIITLYNYYIFLFVDGFSKYYTTFHTIFEAI